MKRYIPILCLVSVLWSNQIRAAEPPQNPLRDTEGITPPGMPLSTLRDPFWPIGWTPPEQASATLVAKATVGQYRWKQALATFELTGLSKKVDGTYVAVLRGVGVVEPGDTIKTVYEGFEYGWQIQEITKKGIEPVRAWVRPVRE